MKYQNKSNPTDVRVNDLLSRMSIEEKIKQMSCVILNDDPTTDTKSISEYGIGSIAALISAKNLQEIADRFANIQKYIVETTRLGIPALIHCEAVNGGVFKEATTFPSAIAQSSTWNPDLVERMAEIVHTQMRAVGYNHALSSVFDISRDPRWGRLTETYGEDETLASALAVAFVSGLQSQLYSEGAIATGKHFVGHGVTECGLNMGQNLITERELREVHCKPFQAAVTDANLKAVMNSYCSINREAIIGSKRILTGILREEIGFDGILVSDYLSVNRLINPYQITPTAVEAGILSIKAGLDVEFPVPFGFTEALISAVDNGKLSLEDIDRSVRRILSVKFDFGLFENPFPLSDRIPEVFHDEVSEKHTRLMAKEAIILLKNDNNLLPLSKDFKKVAVIGPHADSLRSMFGSYSYPGLLDMNEDMRNNGVVTVFKDDEQISYFPRTGTALVQRFPGDIRETPLHVEKKIRDEYPNSHTLFGEIKHLIPTANVTTAIGISYTGNNLANYDEAIAKAAEADIVILTLGGLNGWGLTATNGEGIDNSNIDLPGKQEIFARDIYSLKKKTVVIHFDGKPLINEFVTTHFDAIIEAWQLGEKGADALGAVLFGEYNPAGRLTVTAARNGASLPAYYGSPRGSGYVSAGRFGILSNKNGYVNDTIHPIFKFGHGLSYTQFEYTNLTISDEVVDAKGELYISVNVKNTGSKDGDEVVQLYISDDISSMVRPDQQLIGFKRVHIKSGETRKIVFRLNLSLLAFLDLDMRWKIEGGSMTVKVGSSCEDIRLANQFVINGDEFIDPKQRQFYAVANIE